MYWDGLRTELSTCVRCKAAGNVTRKVLDDLVVEPPIPILFVSEGPGYCEDRTGIPLVGGTELATSGCVHCPRLKECFKYFLKLSPGYKGTELQCTYGYLSNEGIEEMALLDPKVVEKRRPAILKAFAGSMPSTAGEVLNTLLRTVHLTRGTLHKYLKITTGKGPKPDIVMTNIVHCRPTSVSHGKVDNRKPSVVEISNCRQHLLKVIEIVQPKVIVAAGTPAVQALSKEKYAVSQAMRVSPTSVESNVGIPLVPMYHPSFLLRTGGTTNGVESESVSRLVAAKQIAGL